MVGDAKVLSFKVKKYCSLIIGAFLFYLFRDTLYMFNTGRVITRQETNTYYVTVYSQHVQCCSGYREHRSGVCERKFVS